MNQPDRDAADILVVEDEADILELLCFGLHKEGYQVDMARSGEEALRSVRQALPRLLLLDRMLPDMDGLEICRILRQDASTAKLPIIMLTAKGEEEDIVSGLELGADDYVVKPFSPRVLHARIRKALRRDIDQDPGKAASLHIHDLVIHLGRREVWADQTPVSLTNTEFRILYLLACRPGWVYTRNQIVEGVRGEDYPVTERSVDVQMVALRKKMGTRGGYIETVRGVGYRFKDYLP